MNLPDHDTPVRTIAPDENPSIMLLNSFISNNACVLLLGPLFGRDAAGNRVHKQLKSFLSAQSDIRLDDEFDNLCISKKSDGSDSAHIMAGISQYFDNTDRNAIYDDLLKIGFQSIVSFSFDLFLHDANLKEEVYDFRYFNRKGNVQQHLHAEEEYSDKPVIYNIFGDKRDLNSLIVDYDSLYDFLLNIINADSQIPLRLKDIFGKANAFLFLGFDMSKWYIPILIRKLNQFISNNRPRGSINGFVCLDDTSNMPDPGTIDDLNKYPLRFIPFRQTKTENLVRLLVPKSRRNGSKVNLPDITTEQLNFLSTWRDEAFNKDVKGALDSFFSTYRKMNYRGESKKEFEAQGMYYRTIQMRVNSMVMNDKDFFTESIGIVHKLTELIDLIAPAQQEVIYP